MWWPSSSAKFLAAGFPRQRTCPYDRGARLRLISYLAPSIPHALFALVARHVADRCDVETSIVADRCGAHRNRQSGPIRFRALCARDRRRLRVTFLRPRRGCAIHMTVVRDEIEL